MKATAKMGNKSSKKLGAFASYKGNVKSEGSKLPKGNTPRKAGGAAKSNVNVTKKAVAKKLSARGR